MVAVPGACHGCNHAGVTAQPRYGRGYSVVSKHRVIIIAYKKEKGYASFAQRIHDNFHGTFSLRTKFKANTGKNVSPNKYAEIQYIEMALFRSPNVRLSFMTSTSPPSYTFLDDCPNICDKTIRHYSVTPTHVTEHNSNQTTNVSPIEAQPQSSPSPAYQMPSIQAKPKSHPTQSATVQQTPPTAQQFLLARTMLDPFVRA
ncbi:hypothetical protein Tco_0575765 [Tanacetum coccineum]